MAQGGASEVTIGPLGLNDELSTFRANMLPTAKMVWQEKGSVPFLNALLMKKINKRSVDAYKFFSFEQAEEDVYLTATTASAPGVGAATAIVPIQNSHAKQLQIGQLMTNHSVNWSDSGAGYTRPGVPASVTVPEKAQVLLVGAVDSGGAGFTNVTYQRMHSLKSSANNANTNTIFWTIADVIVRGNFAGFDTQGVSNPVTINPFQQTSFCQDFRKAFGVTERENEENKFVIDNPLDFVGKKAKWSFLRDIERELLFDGTGFESNTTGYNRTFSWSINSIIPAANRKTVSSLTKAAYDTALAPMSQVGKDSDVRLIFASQTHLYKVNALFASYLRDEPFAGKKNLGYTVPTYTDPLGVTYQFLFSREMSETSWLTDAAYVVNMSYVNYAAFQGKNRSFDMYVDMGPGGNGLQENDARKTIYELRAVCGLDVNYYASHGQVRF